MAAFSLEQNARHTDNLTRYSAKLLAFLREPETLDVVVNPDGCIWVNRLGSGFQCSGELAVNASRLLLAGVATVREIPFDHEHPVLETIFPLTGDRIEGLIPPVVENPALAIRTRPKKIFSLEEMEDTGIFTDKSDALNVRRNRDDFLDQTRGLKHVDILRLAGKYRKNILLVGPTGSGKTTIANGIIQSWSELTPQDRVIIIEDTPELHCCLPNHVQLLATAHVSQADLLVASMRLIPRRLIVGEIREPGGSQCQTPWVQIEVEGATGVLATIATVVLFRSAN